jgi:hypothetical protein
VLEGVGVLQSIPYGSIYADMRQPYARDLRPDAAASRQSYRQEQAGQSVSMDGIIDGCPNTWVDQIAG